MLGCVYAIAAMGLVLTYTVTGVFNFAHGAVGMIAAFVYYELRVVHALPTPVALVIVVLGLAPLMGLIAVRLLRRFQRADYAPSLVVTVALTVGLLGIAQIGRAHVCTPATNAHLVCRILLDKKQNKLTTT